MIYGIGSNATAAHFAEQTPKAALHAIIAGGAPILAVAPQMNPAAP